MQTKTTVNPYLAFNGNCREAMMFYQQALGGEVELIPYKDSPMKHPQGYEDKIMHSVLRFSEATVMGADNMPDQKAIPGNAITLLIDVENIDDAKRYYKNLSAGGTILMPLEKQFWDAMFGMFIDKYGFTWSINHELNSGK